MFNLLTVCANLPASVLIVLIVSLLIMGMILCCVPGADERFIRVFRMAWQSHVRARRRSGQRRARRRSQGRVRSAQKQVNQRGGGSKG